MRAAASGVWSSVVSVAFLLTPVAAQAAPGDLPSPATAVSVLRVPGGGVDLSWDLPVDYGDGGLTGFVVHRSSAGVDTSYAVPFSASLSWSESDAPLDATYAVSATNPVGEGDTGSYVAQTPVGEALIAAASDRDGGPVRMTEWALPQPVASVSRPAGQGQSDAALGMSLSPDGRMLLSTRPAPGGWQLWSEPVDRSAPPVLLWSSATVLDHPAWSPDGSRVAVGTQASVPSTYVLASTGGAPVREIPATTDPSWMPDGSTLVVSRTAGGPSLPLALVDATSGATKGTLTGTEGATRPEVSPDGRWIAFRRSRVGDVNPRGVYVMPAAGGVARAVPDTTVVVGDLTWSPRGDELGMVLTNMLGSPNSLYRSTIGVDGTPSAVSADLGARVYQGIQRGVWVGARVAIGPAPSITGPGSALPLDASALPPGTGLTCTLDASPSIPCTGSFSVGKLTTGRHMLLVRSQEPSGRETVAARTFVHDSNAPVVRLGATGGAVTLASTTAATYSATDASGVASYDVRSRRAARGGTFGDFATVAAATRSTRAAVPLSAGYQTCWSVRARDQLGNTSAWSSERCTARPIDDRELTRSTTGWTRRTGSSSYLGTHTSTTRSGARLTVASVKARQIYLVATRCPSCGTATIYVGSTKIGSVSLVSATTRRQSILALPTTSLRSGTLSIVATSKSGRLVQVDGIALRTV
ncbi:PD40 domain-containing protein [Phycicoccus sp. DTK01]|uniref:PD40 domain-containing protein n=1 Tax=Phycicoccus sp. DTK01 TaxID=2785745 RepID=UPI001A8D4E6B|nr:PD40 domain-containing protein [Phycicoccus sp. DTK01]GIL34208.1 hypothetical protein PDTK01_02850 [Phycicoccus sp. DTK01]